MLSIRSVKPVAAGFQTDADALLNKFVELKSYNFSDFATIWKDMNFSFIFMGRENLKEAKEFTDECFRLTVSCLHPKANQYFKVGVVYLLYSLYTKQRLESKSKIRIQLDRWKEIRNLLKFGIQEKLHQLCFIILKMLNISAFHFVALPKLMGPRATVTGEVDPEMHHFRYEDTKENFKEFIKSGELEDLTALHERYEKMKRSLDPSISNELTFVTGNEYKTIWNDLKQLVLEGNLEVDELEQAKKKRRKENIGARRVKIKSRQFQRATKNIRKPTRKHSYVSVKDLENAEKAKKIASKNKGKNSKRKGRKRGRSTTPSKQPVKKEQTDETEDPAVVLCTTNGDTAAAASGVIDTGPKKRGERPKRRCYHYTSDEGPSDDEIQGLSEEIEDDPDSIFRELVITE